MITEVKLEGKSFINDVYAGFIGLAMCLWGILLIIWMMIYLLFQMIWSMFTTKDGIFLMLIAVLLAFLLVRHGILC